MVVKYHLDFHDVGGLGMEFRSIRDRLLATVSIRAKLRQIALHKFIHQTFPARIDGNDVKMRFWRNFKTTISRDIAGDGNAFSIPSGLCLDSHCWA